MFEKSKKMIFNVLDRAGYLLFKKKDFDKMMASRKDDVLGFYVNSAPSPQNALSIFEGEWSSRVPCEARSGAAVSFEDDRLSWLEKEIGCKGKTVLELGPLEGGHSYMLQKMGAKIITSVEGNSRAYLKCLVVKELLGLQRVNFLYGDFVEYLKETDKSYDICLASGVLYHMRNPAELIDLLSRHCQGHLFLWTHYFDEKILKKKPAYKSRFPRAVTANYKGFDHILHQYEYSHALIWQGFCGGSAPFSHWMSREDIFRCLEYFGFDQFKVNFEEPLQQNGPGLAIIARKKGSK